MEDRIYDKESNEDSEDLDDLLNYLIVQPNRAFHVKTRYIYCGRGEPRSFPLEDELEDSEIPD